MIYYRRYSGDYLRKTPRLTLIEHGAYCLLLDYYYTDEQPLPLDRAELYTMVRAMTPADRKAVDKALNKFFEERQDGFHQSRADHEIDVSQKARTNGKGGGRPPGGSQTGSLTGDITGSQTGMVTEEQTEHETEPTTGDGGGSVHPLAVNHLAVSLSAFQPFSLQPLENTLSGNPPDTSPSKDKLNGHRATARDILTFLNEKTGKHFEPVDANLELIVARLKEATPDDIRAVIAMKCREWLADEKMNYCLRPATLFARTKFAQYKGELKP